MGVVHAISTLLWVLYLRVPSLLLSIFYDHWRVVGPGLGSDDGFLDLLLFVLSTSSLALCVVLSSASVVLARAAFVVVGLCSSYRRGRTILIVVVEVVLGCWASFGILHG